MLKESRTKNLLSLSTLFPKEHTIAAKHDPKIPHWLSRINADTRKWTPKENRRSHHSRLPIIEQKYHFVQLHQTISFPFRGPVYSLRIRCSIRRFFYLPCGLHYIAYILSLGNHWEIIGKSLGKRIDFVEMSRYTSR